MKRDMDLIRQIVIAARDHDGEHPLNGIDGVERRVFGEHVMLLCEAGLIDGNAMKSGNGTPVGGLVRRLTWDGQDFADAIDNDTVWESVKGSAKKAGGWTFGLLVEIAKYELKKRIGMTD